MFINYFENKTNKNLVIDLKNYSVMIREETEVIGSAKNKLDSVFFFINKLSNLEMFVKEYSYTVESKNTLYINLHLTLLKPIDNLNKDKCKELETSWGIYCSDECIKFNWINQHSYSEESKDYIFYTFVNLLAIYFDI